MYLDLDLEKKGQECRGRKQGLGMCEESGREISLEFEINMDLIFPYLGETNMSGGANQAWECDLRPAFTHVWKRGPGRGEEGRTREIRIFDPFQ